ncbi:MAG: hypothetical protein KAS98_16170, partial [Deltaproteobacteria bacterium]|nr:hypothetical protein [Deltaproteobacteria bacterium]
MARSKSPPSQIDLKKKQNVIKELQFLLPITHNDETDPAKIEIALRERIKELNCLYGISLLAERYSDSIDDLLRNLV